MRSLVEAPLPDLERLAHALGRAEAGAVLPREGLARAQPDAFPAHLGHLLGRDVATARAPLHAAMRDRESIVYTAGSHTDKETDKMCRRVTCPRCDMATFAGCGVHVEQVLGSVPVDQRCSCDNSSPQPPRESGAKRKGWWPFA